MNWLYIMLVSVIILIVLFVKAFRHKRYSRSSLIAAIAHIPYYLVNGVAPVRGVLDSDYAGYNFGLMHVDPGIMVTLASGSMLIAAAWSMVINLQNREDRSLYIVFITDLYFLIIFGVPALFQIVIGGSPEINLGEYLRLSGLTVILIYAMIFVLPLMYSFYRTIKIMISKKLFDF